MAAPGPSRRMPRDGAHKPLLWIRLDRIRLDRIRLDGIRTGPDPLDYLSTCQLLFVTCALHLNAMHTGAQGLHCILNAPTPKTHTQNAP